MSVDDTLFRSVSKVDSGPVRVVTKRVVRRHAVVVDTGGSGRARVVPECVGLARDA